jgi:hypothetical protein
MICIRCQHEKAVTSRLQTVDTHFFCVGKQVLGPEWDKGFKYQRFYVGVWCVPSAIHVSCIMDGRIKFSASVFGTLLHTTCCYVYQWHDSNSVPLCGHSIPHSPIILAEDTACGADSQSDVSRYLCVPGRASRVTDLVQQSDAGTLNDPLPGQMVMPALHFLTSSD